MRKDCCQSELFDKCKIGLTVRAGARASVRVVPERVNVHATLSVGIVAADVP